MTDTRKRVGLLSAARQVQAQGRYGDTVLAHISPEEARWLHQATDGASVNPRTGLLEFWNGGGSDPDGGTAGGPGGSGPGADNGGGGSDNGGGGNSDPGGAAPDADTGSPSASPGSGGLEGGGLGALSAATSDPDSDEEAGSGLAGLDFSAAISGPTGFGDGLAASMNPEVGGGLSRSIGHDTVTTLGPTPAGMLSGTNVNAASAVAAGRAPSIGDNISDFFGDGAPRGLLGSRATTMGVGLLGTALGGPFLGAAASLAHGITAGNQPPGAAIGSALGGMVGGPLGGWAGGKIGAELDAMGPVSAGAMSSSPAPSGAGGLLSQVADPTSYAQSLGVDPADMGRRGLLPPRRTFTPIRMG